MLGAILGLPEQIDDAKRIAAVSPLGALAGRKFSSLVVAGLGGSAIGGDFLRAGYEATLALPVTVVRDYHLPGYVGSDTLVFAASNSGNTEETLAAYEAAGALGARRIVATTGGKLAEMARADKVPVIPLPRGFQPRAAVAYSLVVALEVAALCGVGERLHCEIDVAAAHAEGLVADWGPDAPDTCLPKQLARGLLGTVPQVAGAGLTAPIAYRWKTQVNENAKIPCFAHELPELDHNELAGWEGAPELGRFSAVFLDDSDLHPRIGQRIELTRDLIANAAAATYRVESVGESRVERLVSLVLLGDLVSLYLAVLRGVDPSPVAVIERLKGELGRG
jgi:glucose/mannose-6-phosphate isomerase